MGLNLNLIRLCHLFDICMHAKDYGPVFAYQVGRLVDMGAG